MTKSSESELAALFTRVLTSGGMGAGLHEKLRSEVVGQWVLLLTDATVEHLATGLQAQLEGARQAIAVYRSVLRDHGVDPDTLLRGKL